MSNIITIAYTTEGATDQRFLESIIRKTFEEVALTCKGEIEVFDPVYIELKKNMNFIENIKNLAITALNIGINVFCIHADSDNISDEHVFKHKIVPAVQAVNTLPVDKACNNLVAIVPVRMSEAWMLADTDLLKEEFNTTKTDSELFININPETIADPKAVIEKALQLAQDHLPQRRNRIIIGELYQPLGQKIQLNKLEQLSSFKKFKLSVEDAFRKLNYLST